MSDYKHTGCPGLVHKDIQNTQKTTHQHNTMAGKDLHTTALSLPFPDWYNGHPEDPQTSRNSHTQTLLNSSSQRSLHCQRYSVKGDNYKLNTMAQGY